MIKASKLIGMTDRELIVQLEKASVTLARLKSSNASLRRRVRELEAGKSPIANSELAGVPNNTTALTPMAKTELQELKEQLESTTKAAVDNLTYAQQMKILYEELKASLATKT